MMRGRIVVMRQEDYADWLATQPEGDDLAHEGAKLFVAQGCSGCHAEVIRRPRAETRRPVWPDRPPLRRTSDQG